MKMKIVYVVTGSEDGILGVYGNKKGAYEHGLRYLKNYPSNEIISYQKLCNELKDCYDYDVQLRDTFMGSNVTIMATLFNRKDTNRG